MNILQMLFGSKKSQKKKSSAGNNTYLYRISYTRNGHKDLYPTYAKCQHDATEEFTGVYPDAVINNISKSKQN